MLYLDANVFLHAALHRGAASRAAVRLLERMAKGEEAGATCALTFDEVLWGALRREGRPAALRIAAEALRTPNLRILDVRGEDVQRALTLMEAHARLQPRDAIHAAVALNAGIVTVVSDDADFDALDGLDRRPLR